MGTSAWRFRRGGNAGAASIGEKRVMTIDLPSADTTRWTTWRKTEVVAAVHNGLLGLGEACERYRMSVEEFRNWEQLVNKRGFQERRTAQLGDYRQPFRGASNSEN